MCGGRIKTIVYIDKLFPGGNVHGEEWKCENGHLPDKVMYKN